jgi:hypothetical protein
LIESSPGGGRRDGLERLLEACVRHRSAELAESTSLIVKELIPDGHIMTDDLLLLAVEVSQ